MTYFIVSICCTCTIGKYHACRCPGSSSRQAINNCDFDYGNLEANHRQVTKGEQVLQYIYASRDHGGWFLWFNNAMAM